MSPLLARTRSELAAALASRPGRRAVVMTMGALHEGHLSLVRTARDHAEQVVVTIFVNPLQFGPQEDLARYPRDLEGDLARLSGAGADVVFAPDVTEVYPGGEPDVRVSAGRLGQRLEGRHRPGHFDGVLTVVLKMLHLVAPDVAVFGQKDAQQLMAVRRMVRDLDVPVEVVAGVTVRDPDGVAMSSRNAYLSATQRPAARRLSAALLAAEDAARRGARAPDVLRLATDRLADATDVAVDYVALVHPDTAEDVPDDHRGPAVLAVAAEVGGTRLIDNVLVDLTADELRRLATA